MLSTCTIYTESRISKIISSMPQDLAVAESTRREGTLGGLLEPALTAFGLTLFYRVFQLIGEPF